jgi:hypothetical protein
MAKRLLVIEVPSLIGIGLRDRLARRPGQERLHVGDLLALLDDDRLGEALEPRVVPVLQQEPRRIDCALMVRDHHPHEVAVDIAGRRHIHCDMHAHVHVRHLGVEGRFAGWLGSAERRVHGQKAAARPRGQPAISRNGDCQGKRQRSAGATGQHHHRNLCGPVFHCAKSRFEGRAARRVHLSCGPDLVLLPDCLDCYDLAHNGTGRPDAVLTARPHGMAQRAQKWPQNTPASARW